MSDWIKCSERMPENGANVICVGFIFDNPENGQWVVSCVFEDGTFYGQSHDGQGEICIDYDIEMHPPTHWMPLPEPPK